MDMTSGKLKNLTTEKTLTFSNNPGEFQLSCGFDFDVNSRLGQTRPVIAFQSGGPAQFSFSLFFDEDADEEFEVNDIYDFLSEVGKVDEKSKSVPSLLFYWGDFSFQGYVQNYSLRPTRFNNKGGVTSIQIDLSLISDGTYEEKGCHG